MQDTTLDVRPVADDEWDVVAWLWQAFRHDLAPVVQGLPYADGRYRWSALERFPSADAAGLLARRAHPVDGRPAPVGFALVEGLAGAERTVTGFWTAPPVRRDGVGRALARAMFDSWPGPWTIGFQHDNPGAGAFWRKVADAQFGPAGWTETRLPVTRRSGVPDDHLIRGG